jgi:hypothetical protein
MGQFRPKSRYCPLNVRDNNKKKCQDKSKCLLKGKTFGEVVAMLTFFHIDGGTVV